LSSFCAFGVMGPGIFGFGVMIAMDREQGLLKLKRAMPVPLASYLIAKMIMSIAFALIAAGGVVIAALAFGKLIVSTGTLVTLVGMLVLGAVPFCAIGMLIGAYASANAAPAYVNLIYLPGMYLSGMFFPLPEILRPWALIWPAFHLNQTALGVAGIAEFSFVPPMITGGVLVAITVLCGGLALRRIARVG
jgi:ABC-2 type transport system permease protein